MKDKVVKIDADLLREIEKLISKKENKLKYINKKQFVDLAVFEKLKRENKGVNNGR